VPQAIHLLQEEFSDRFVRRRLQVTYLQDRNRFGVGEFDTSILDQPRKAEVIK
jgi:hypothetical protein